MQHQPKITKPNGSAPEEWSYDDGDVMAAAARAFWIGNGDAEVSTEKALAALDAAAEGYIGADAEFDDELSSYSPLSRLVAIAFEATAEELADLKGEREVLDNDDYGGRLWYKGPYQDFHCHKPSRRAQ